VIDSTVGEEGGRLTVCGCKSGSCSKGNHLGIRSDQEGPHGPNCSLRGAPSVQRTTEMIGSSSKSSIFNYYVIIRSFNGAALSLICEKESFDKRILF
jgi:hypothetical protein